jgi:hypothetical protein
MTLAGCRSIRAILRTYIAPQRDWTKLSSATARKMREPIYFTLSFDTCIPRGTLSVQIAHSLDSTATAYASDESSRRRCTTGCYNPSCIPKMIHCVRYLAPRGHGRRLARLPSFPDGLAQYHQLALWQSWQCAETGYRSAYWKKVNCS